MKILSKTRERFYWDRLRAVRDVEKWCRECHACEARKGPKTRTKGCLQRYNVGAPFERMALDILRPFPVTTKGNRYVLVLMIPSPSINLPSGLRQFPFQTRKPRM
ncbi:hypothetical protein AVEN_70221-1 [Araneus ventricosus]|uniref:Integrase zinc-binding domain-containing protein n=1 Tax=Araneus ventricosus TaxID=182803 RepID=A0A4Y2VKP9_ARAVE|nr:hypothetical protein AVEN_70221-1 [Araneus ventricosus]